MLKLNFFGSGYATYNDLPLPGFPRQQAYQILCYLLLSPRRPHLRESLSNLFWSEHPSPTAKKYLRNSLWRLRQSFEGVQAKPDDYLMIEEDYVAFNSSNPYWLDIEFFENTILRYQTIPVANLTTEMVTDIEKAVALYTGDLLEGNFEDWCLVERERLSVLHLKSLTRLMTFYDYCRQPEKALAIGEKILQHDNTRETIHLQMMKLYYEINDRDAALRQYRRCKQILNDELSLQPMKETTTFFNKIIRDQHSEAHLGGINLRTEPSSIDSNKTENSPLLVEYALKKLHQLQGVLEDTTAEIHRLENILNQVQVHTKNP